MQTYFVLGDRCSGTNFFHRLILDNFDVPPDDLGEWKHFFGHDKFNKTAIDNPDSIFLCVIRNPVDYLMSFWNSPHHQPPERLLNLETFLLSEFYSTGSPPERLEIMEDRNYLNENKRFKNVFEARSIRCNYLLNILPTIASKTYFTTFENLKYNTINVLDSIKNKFNLKKTKDEYYVEKQCVHVYKIFPNRPIKENYPVTEDTLQIIRSNLDWKIENQLGYSL